MKNIIVVRIDDRLIHGQVVTSWIRSYPITDIVIIAEDLSKNMLMQRIYKSVAPDGIRVAIFNNPDALAFLNGEGNPKENIMILVKTPDVLEYLFDNGIHFSKIILGGMGAKPGREVLIRNVSANEAEKETLLRLIDKGIEIVYQMIPIDNALDVEKLLRGK